MSYIVTERTFKVREDDPSYGYVKIKNTRHKRISIQADSGLVLSIKEAERFLDMLTEAIKEARNLP